MVTTATDEDVVAAARIAEAFDPLLRQVDRWRDDLQDEFAALAAAGAEPTAALLDPFVADRSLPSLEEPGGLMTGAGFVAAPGILSDAPWHLAWWLRVISAGDPAEPSRTRRLETVDDPASDRFRDYRQLEWWRVPERTRERHLTGPYVDYLCTDDYTVTVTTPVLQEGRMIGVVGADVHVSRLERVLLPVLRALTGTATIVNGSGRVIASADAHRATGVLLRAPEIQDALTAVREGRAPLGGGVRATACGGTSLVLVREA